MKNLLKKEFSFSAVPLTYIFILFGFMTLLPGYPILCGAFFVCLGIFYTFQTAREGNDVLYSVLLPVRKKDVVKARYIFVVSIQMMSFLINSGLTVIRMTVLNTSSVYAENVMMNANIVYLGFVLIVFSAFNGIFCRGFWKDAYKIGAPFIISSVVIFLIIGLGETLSHVPGLKFFNANNEYLSKQFAILIFCGLIYFLTTFISCKKSMKDFEKVQL